MRKRIKRLVTILLSGVIAFGVVGCGDSGKSNSDNKTTDEVKAENTNKADDNKDNDSTEYTGDVKKIKIGIGNSYNPFCYLDENEKQQGYDYWVTQEIQKRLPQYEFVYEATEFSNILVGLDADKYDIAVHHYGWNAERNEKYLYAKIADWGGTGYVIAAAPGLDIKDENDLKGLYVQCSATNNTSYLLEKFNETLPEDEKIHIVYDDASGEVLWNNVATGVYDATIPDEFSFDQSNPKYGNILEKYGHNVLGDVIAAEQEVSIPGTYFIYNFGDEQLRDDIDAALYDIIQDGTLAELSEKYLGKDYITGTEDTLLILYDKDKQ